MMKALTVAAALAMPATSAGVTNAAEKLRPADVPVYYVIYQDVRDQARFSAYVQAVTPAIAKRGGVLVAAGAPTFTEGALPYRRLVVFRYPSGRALEQFIHSPEYAGIRSLRDGAADWSSAIVPALAGENDK